MKITLIYPGIAQIGFKSFGSGTPTTNLMSLGLGYVGASIKKHTSWKADEILEAIDSSRDKKEDVEIVLMPRDSFTWMAMEYRSYLRGMPFNFIGDEDSPESVLQADYVLIKKGGFVAPWFAMDYMH